MQNVLFCRLIYISFVFVFCLRCNTAESHPQKPGDSKTHSSLFNSNNELCDDGNICTTDSMGLEGCVFLPNTLTCSGYDPCDGFAKCHKTNCWVLTDSNCNDDNVCTKDYCDPEFTCRHTPQSTDCDKDGESCTQDFCKKGICVHISNRIGKCTDDNKCTVDDHCVNGSCVPESVLKNCTPT